MLWARAGAVGFDDAGALHVHESIPEVPVGPANAGDASQSPWFAGDFGTHGSDSAGDTDISKHSSGGGFFSSLFGGDTGGSLCSSNSSCSGSSCGGGSYGGGM